jgi:hypothetical protein
VRLAVKAKESLGPWKNDKCFRFGPMRAAGAGQPGPLRIWVRFVIDPKNPSRTLFRYSVGKQLGTPNTHAPWRMDMPTPYDEDGMGVCKCLRKLLKG